ncbi:UDP-N-acetylmuramoyl-tripeptide--D-alanyl-D-alanine ligase [Ascidiimonas aurantiaca]|uniref:UDP-N-acetylmuramoyl-tripeptide--D-alanyl-D- alanine ligase n=1 Tax=Ascidiimonas aurantiaca TaxID=1685432 RepID=UPI0030EBC8B8
MEIEKLYTRFLESTGASTDSRSITPECIFFALKGDHFDGNLFAKNALDQGAAMAVIDNPSYEIPGKTLLVSNVLETLQKLATHHRRQLKTPLISLTGSNGKTTTKELIHAVISTSYRTVATTGNLNNHIGVPLTLLRLQPDTQIGIIEMGANHQKEIAFLCEIAEPDYGLITNYGKAHLEGFGGVQGVIKGKSELYDHLKTHKKHIFYYREDPIQVEKLKTYSRKSSFGPTSEADLTILMKSTEPFVTLEVNNTEIKSNLIGSYNFNNIAYAIAIGKHFQVPITLIKQAIEAYVPKNNRSQILQKGRNRIILDAYNANPSSMKVVLENFEKNTDPQKLVILGDMFELGEDAAAEHQYIADLAARLNNTEVLLVGEHFHNTLTQSKKFRSYEDLETWLRAHLPENKTVLIKGSRGMALERILDLW